MTILSNRNLIQMHGLDILWRNIIFIFVISLSKSASPATITVVGLYLANDIVLYTVYISRVT